MNNEQIAIALVAGTESDLIDLNDWAVNTVRGYCRAYGYNAVRLIAEETVRIDGKARGSLNLYLTVRRTGSHYRLQRAIRKAVFAVIMSRRALSA